MFRLPEARKSARPWSHIRMVCSSSPWARYRWLRKPWTRIGVAPRPSSVARRSASSPAAPPQPDPVAEPPGQGLGLTHQGETPPILSQGGQRLSQREAEVEGQHPGVAGLGQVRKGLERVLEGSHRLAERGAFAGPDAGLL